MIDLQLNGYLGVDFNSPGLTAEQLHHVCQRLLDDGVTGCLPTIITHAMDHMESCLQSIALYREHDPLIRRVVRGLHIEGPFLSPEPGYIGAHPVEHACVADRDKATRLVDACGGLAKIFTLAPEQDPEGHVTRWLTDQGLVVAAGHTNASLDDLQRAHDNGLRMVTHLGNGCPMMLHRHDNIIQRLLRMSDRLWFSLIADGAHVPWCAFCNYVQQITLERTCVVSDAISAAGQGAGRFALGHQTVDIGEDLIPWAADRSHFVGSATTMRRARENLSEQGFSPAAIDRLTDENPSKILDGQSPASP